MIEDEFKPKKIIYLHRNRQTKLFQTKASKPREISFQTFYFTKTETQHTTIFFFVSRSKFPLSLFNLCWTMDDALSDDDCISRLANSNPFD